MKVDLHVHTTQYSRCSRVDPTDVVPAAVRAGLDVVVITEHNTLWPAEDFKRFDNDRVRVFNGMEITASDGHDYLAIGPDLVGFYGGMDYDELSWMANRSGAALIVAHPFRFSVNPPGHLREMNLAAVEVASVNMYGPRERVLADELARELAVASVASSDAHMQQAIGARFTLTKRPIHTVEDLVGCLRDRLVEPVVRNPRPDDLVDCIRGCQAERVKRKIDHGMREPESIKAVTGAPLDVIHQMLGGG